MKKLVLKKTAGLIVLLMTITMLVPVIAFASAGFSNVISSNGNVTGQVYISQDVYDQIKANNESVQVEVYAENGFHWTVDATYSHPVNGSVYYDFSVSSTTYATYSKLKFNYFYPGNNVISDVYYDRSSSTGGGYYGGGIPSSGPIVFANGNVDADSLAAALKADGTATITTDVETIYLPASALVGGKSLTIANSEGVSYMLPISSLDLQKLAGALGVELKDLTIRVDMKEVAGDAATKVAAAVYKVGESIAPAYEFKVVAQGNDKEQEITNFGQYVSRTLPLTETVTDSTYNVTGVYYNADTNEVSFVPTTFATANGKSTATLKRNGNSIYTVVKVKAVSFTDMVGNWAKDDVNTLASKLIVEGTGANKFEPKRNITRAEFAAMVVRSLGLEASGKASFKDVASSKWYAGAVAAAADAGIIKGYGDGTFNPNANISRKEVAAMVVRAMAYAGKEVKLSDTEVSTALANYTDAASLGWAKAEVAVAIQSGVVKGQTSSKVVGDANANRAEAATMIIRFLSNVGFIN